MAEKRKRRRTGAGSLGLNVTPRLRARDQLHESVDVPLVGSGQHFREAWTRTSYSAAHSKKLVLTTSLVRGATRWKLCA